MAKLRKTVSLLLADAEEEQGIVTAAPAVPVREIFGRFWSYARPYRRWLPLILILVALGPAIQAATIWMYKVLIDEVLIPRNFDLLVWVMLAYLGLTLVEGFVSFCDEYLSEWVGGRFIVGLRTDLFRHLHSLSLGFFDRQSLGDMISRVSDDVDEIEELMLSGLTSALAYVFQLVFFMGGALLPGVEAGVGVAASRAAVLARGQVLLAEDQTRRPRGAPPQRLH